MSSELWLEAIVRIEDGLARLEGTLARRLESDEERGKRRKEVREHFATVVGHAAENNKLFWVQTVLLALILWRVW
jgi:hypothetical protein